MAAYDEEAVDDLVAAATGAARILQEMEVAEEEDQAQAHAYRLLHEALWEAVENVLGHNPMEQ